jgi:hypothetical protein
MSAQDVRETEAAVVAAGSDVEEIKAGIERTQADLADTVAELQRKLSPSHMVGRAKENAREKLRVWGNTSLSMAAIAITRTEDLARDARSRMKASPASAALIGAGLAALLWHGARRRRRGSVRDDRARCG